jgi:hypothetical protein
MRFWLVFTDFWLVFTRVRHFWLVFTRVRQFLTRVHSCSQIFDSCSQIFDSCSLVLSRVHSCSDSCGLLEQILNIAINGLDWMWFSMVFTPYRIRSPKFLRIPYIVVAQSNSWIILRRSYYCISVFKLGSH